MHVGTSASHSSLSAPDHDSAPPQSIATWAAELTWWPTETLTIDATLGCIPNHTTSLDITEPTQAAIAAFKADCTLPGILIKNQIQLLGVLSRQRFYELMSRPFSLELFTQRPLFALWKIMASSTLILEAELAITLAAHRALQRHAEDIYEPIIVQHPDGRSGVIDIHALLLAQGAIHELALRELGTHKQTLAAERDLAKITLNAIADGVITTDIYGQVQDLNPVAEKLTGYSRSQAIGQPISAIFQPLDEHSKQTIANPVQSVLEGQISVYSKQPTQLYQQNNYWDIQYSASPILDGKQQLLGVILVFRDVTQQQVLLRRIHWQASHDALTGLVNRVEFETQLSSRIASARDRQPLTSHVLIYLDLDRFKAVNDTCGHFAGDELLRQVGNLMNSCLREQDLLARLGGDEFGILLIDCDLEQGKLVSDRIYQAIQDFRFVWQDYVFTIGASIGMTEISGHLGAVDVLRQADSACYLAKHQGRNQVCCYEDFNQGLAGAQPTQIVTRINQALSHAKFGLFYQKIFAAQPHHPSSPALFASEILLRLPDEERGWIRPDTFLQTAERYNLMTEIDTWVIKRFCQSYDHICALSQGTVFSINLSGASLNSDRLAAFIRTQLTTHRIPPQNICFEVTETVAIANLTRARSLLQELKDFGCGIALDDFGSGMSSFHYLRSLPVDYLKIDGSLIRDMLTDRVALEMVSAIIKIGHEMGLKTVAEWVENEAVIDLLTAQKNDYLQGFLLHSPTSLQLS